jgi:hypothetical protein
MRLTYTRAEPFLAVPVALATLLLLPRTGVEVSVADVFRDAGILMLLQSLVRDVYLLASGRAAGANGTPRRGWFLCVESALGLGLVCQGVLLWALGTPTVVALPAAAWAGCVLVWWWVGYAVREVVFEIRRDPHHLNLLIGPRG